MERTHHVEVERDLEVLGMRRWRDLVTEKNGRILFDRPKPTVGCSANGRRRRRRRIDGLELSLGGGTQAMCPVLRTQSSRTLFPQDIELQ